MLPDPLHPAVVHFPIVFVVLLPIVAVLALWAIRRGAGARIAWAAPVALAAALTVAAWVAIETGEAQEERVEDVVGERVLHEHEEAAERFLVLSGVLLVVAGGGLLGGSIGAGSRLVATVGALGLVLAGYQVGASGGDMVYEHGAASAYVAAGAGATGGAADTVERYREEEGEDH